MTLPATGARTAAPPPEGVAGAATTACPEAAEPDTGAIATVPAGATTTL